MTEWLSWTVLEFPAILVLQRLSARGGIPVSQVRWFRCYHTSSTANPRYRVPRIVHRAPWKTKSVLFFSSEDRYRENSWKKQHQWHSNGMKRRRCWDSRSGTAKTYVHHKEECWHDSDRNDCSALSTLMASLVLCFRPSLWRPKGYGQNQDSETALSYLLLIRKLTPTFA